MSIAISQTASSATPLWSPLQILELRLAAHPLMQGFRVSVAGVPGEVVARLHYREHVVEARVEGSDWQEPARSMREKQSIERIARALYVQWLALLQRT